MKAKPGNTAPSGFAPKANGHDERPKDIGIRGDQLDDMEFQPLEWLIEGVLPIGAGLIAGKAKIGKSWFVLDIGLGVATGTFAFGKIKCTQAEVLYLALEDGPRRLHSRQRKLMGTGPPPAGIEYFTTWPTIDEGFFPALERYIEEHPKCRLVIVDTLGKIRGRPDGRKSIFQQDYSDLAAFQQFALLHKIAILIVHHARKQGSDDVMDQISGTTAVQAAVDTLIVMTRKRGQTAGTVSISGKDIEEEGEYAIEFDKLTGRWNWLGEAGKVRKDTEQQKVYDLLAQSANCMSPTEISTELELSSQTVKSALKRLKKLDSVANPARGLWGLSTREYPNL